MLTLVYTHSPHTHTEQDKETNTMKAGVGGGALNLTARHYALWTKACLILPALLFRARCWPILVLLTSSGERVH